MIKGEAPEKSFYILKHDVSKILALLNFTMLISKKTLLLLKGGLSHFIFCYNVRLALFKLNKTNRQINKPDNNHTFKIKISDVPVVIISKTKLMPH